MNRYILLAILAPVFLYSKAVKVDEILTDTKKFKVETTISYSNINKRESLVAPIAYQTSNGDFVNIPTYMGSAKSNQDYINYGLNLKYGVSKKLELFSNINFYTNTIHISGNNFQSKSDKDFNNLNVGAVYQVKKENDTPSLLIGASVDLYERVKFAENRKKMQHFKNYSLFMTSFYTVDPVVFLLKTHFRHSLKKRFNGETIDSGDIFALSPNIYFAVNPYTSISWGVRYQLKGKDRVNNKVVSNVSSSVGYTFGVSYEIDHRMTLNFDTEKLDTDDYSSSNINLSLAYKF